MASDPNNPKCGDRFWNVAHTRSILVTCVGEQNILGIEDTTTNEITLALTVVATLQPADPPVLEKDLMLYEFKLGEGERGLWSNANSTANTGRRVIMHPNGTWTLA